MKKGKLLVSLMLVLAMGLTACGGGESSSTSTANTGEQNIGNTGTGVASAKQDNILRMALEQDIETLDSQQNTADFTASVAEGVTSSLLREHMGEYVLDLAESYETDDYITWTFKIREDAAWSDGTPITAHDFEYSWKELFHRPEGSKVHGFFAGMVGYADIYEAMENDVEGDELRALTDKLGVTATDDHTLVVELESPRPWYIANFAASYFAPIHKELYEANGANYGSSMETMAYCGPFYVSEWRYNESVTLTPNPYYWDKENIKLDGVEISIVKDVEPRINMFREGSVNFARATSEYYETLADSLKTYSGAGWTYILTNMNRLDVDKNVVNQEISDLLANRNFINAINYAIDREVLFGQVITDPTRFGTDIIVSDVIHLNNDSDETFGEARARLDYQSPVPMTADNDKAKEYLQAAMDDLGYTDVSQIPAISIMVTTGSENVSVCEYINLVALDVLGINLEVELVEFGVRDGRIISGDYDMCIMGWGLDYPDALSIYEVWYTDLFATAWPVAYPEQHAAFVEMMDYVSTADDFVARGEALMDIEAYLMEHGPFITINLSGYAGLLTNDLENFNIRDAGTRFDYIYASFSY